MIARTTVIQMKLVMYPRPSLSAHSETQVGDGGNTVDVKAGDDVIGVNESEKLRAAGAGRQDPAEGRIMRKWDG
jgi:hypothetical protein